MQDKVSNSQTHIVPDGEHQEYLFRIIEGYDPGIEHIGSWHSHHCNGYPDLSSGDIQGYIHNVNDRNYNLDWFFVMLVVSVSKRGIETKYYLFHRGDENYYVVDGSNVSILNQDYQYENILREVENSTYSYRNQTRTTVPIVSNIESNRSWEDFMMDIRAEDKAWIERYFPSNRTFRNKKDNSIYWRLSLPLSGRDNLEATYAYPSHPNMGKRAALSFHYLSQEILRSTVELNEHRFEDIFCSIEQAKDIVNSLKQE